MTEKRRFLFGSEVAPVDGHETGDRLRSTVDEVIATQIAEDDPPELTKEPAGGRLRARSPR